MEEGQPRWRLSQEIDTNICICCKLFIVERDEIARMPREGCSDMKSRRETFRAYSLYSEVQGTFY